MTTSDLDPDALEAAAQALGQGTFCSGAFCAADDRDDGKCTPCLRTAKIVAELAIRAYLTAREPGVTGKGEMI